MPNFLISIWVGLSTGNVHVVSYPNDRSTDWRPHVTLSRPTKVRLFHSADIIRILGVRREFTSVTKTKTNKSREGSKKETEQSDTKEEQRVIFCILKHFTNAWFPLWNDYIRVVSSRVEIKLESTVRSKARCLPCPVCGNKTRIDCPIKGSMPSLPGVWK